MSVISRKAFSPIETNIIFLRDVRHITVAADICKHLRNVSLEEVENLLTRLENCNIRFC